MEEEEEEEEKEGGWWWKCCVFLPLLNVGATREVTTWYSPGPGPRLPGTLIRLFVVVEVYLTVRLYLFLSGGGLYDPGPTSGPVVMVFTLFTGIFVPNVSIWGVVPFLVTFSLLDSISRESTVAVSVSLCTTSETLISLRTFPN